MSSQKRRFGQARVDPISREKQLANSKGIRTIVPTKDQRKNAIQYYTKDWFENTTDPRVQDAIIRTQVEMGMRNINSKVDAEFEARFHAFLTGRMADVPSQPGRPFTKTPIWGNRWTSLMHDPEVKAYINELNDQRFEFDRFIKIMEKMGPISWDGKGNWGPPTMLEYYLYFKYVLEEHADRDTDTYLEDWKIWKEKRHHNTGFHQYDPDGNHYVPNIAPYSTTTHKFGPGERDHTWATKGQPWRDTLVEDIKYDLTDVQPGQPNKNNDKVIDDLNALPPPPLGFSGPNAPPNQSQPQPPPAVLQNQPSQKALQVKPKTLKPILKSPTNMPPPKFKVNNTIGSQVASAIKPVVTIPPPTPPDTSQETAALMKRLDALRPKQRPAFSEEELKTRFAALAPKSTPAPPDITISPPTDPKQVTKAPSTPMDIEPGTESESSDDGVTPMSTTQTPRPTPKAPELSTNNPAPIKSLSELAQQKIIKEKLGKTVTDIQRKLQNWNNYQQSVKINLRIAKAKGHLDKDVTALDIQTGRFSSPVKTDFMSTELITQFTDTVKETVALYMTQLEIIDENVIAAAAVEAFNDSLIMQLMEKDYPNVHWLVKNEFLGPSALPTVKSIMRVYLFSDVYEDIELKGEEELSDSGSEDEWLPNEIPLFPDPPPDLLQRLQPLYDVMDDFDSFARAAKFGFTWKEYLEENPEALKRAQVFEPTRKVFNPRAVFKAMSEFFYDNADKQYWSQLLHTYNDPWGWLEDKLTDKVKQDRIIATIMLVTASMPKDKVDYRRDTAWHKDIINSLIYYVAFPSDQTSLPFKPITNKWTPPPETKPDPRLAKSQKPYRAPETLVEKAMDAMGMFERHTPTNVYAPDGKRKKLKGRDAVVQNLEQRKALAAINTKDAPQQKLDRTRLPNPKIPANIGEGLGFRVGQFKIRQKPKTTPAELKAAQTLVANTFTRIKLAATRRRLNNVKPRIQIIQEAKDLGVDAKLIQNYELINAEQDREALINAIVEAKKAQSTVDEKMKRAALKIQAAWRIRNARKLMKEMKGENTAESLFNITVKPRLIEYWADNLPVNQQTAKVKEAIEYMKNVQPVDIETWITKYPDELMDLRVQFKTSRRSSVTAADPNVQAGVVNPNRSDRANDLFDAYIAADTLNAEQSALDLLRINYDEFIVTSVINNVKVIADKITPTLIRGAINIDEAIKPSLMNKKKEEKKQAIINYIKKSARVVAEVSSIASGMNYIGLRQMNRDSLNRPKETLKADPELQTELTELEDRLGIDVVALWRLYFNGAIGDLAKVKAPPVAQDIIASAGQQPFSPSMMAPPPPSRARATRARNKGKQKVDTNAAREAARNAGKQPIATVRGFTKPRNQTKGKTKRKK